MKYDSRIEVIDSCIILRVLEGDLPGQREKAYELFLSGRDLYVDGAVISEVVYVMKKNGYERGETVDKIKTLLANPMFVYDRKFFDPIFKEYVKRPSLSFEDLAIAKRAEERECVPLWTFDRKLANQSEVAELLS